MSAKEDAAVLRDYFVSATGGGGKHWKLCVKGRRGMPPTRVDVLRGVVDLARSVPCDGAGVVYFSGHARVGRSGLLLTCYDSDGELEDSAVSVSRVLSILREEGKRSAYFLIILDCCRDGVTRPAVQEWPDNVCVVYACGHGESAREGPGGGYLRGAIVEALNHAGRTGTAPYLTVRALSNGMRRYTAVSAPASAFGFEWIGGCGDEVALPVAYSETRERGDAPMGPTAWLKYSLGTEREFADVCARLAMALQQWYGISRKDRAGISYVMSHFDWGPGTYIVRVRIPDGGLVWGSGEVLEQLLNAGVREPGCLVIAWPGLVAFEKVKWLRSVVGDGEWHGVEGERTLRWKNWVEKSAYRGSLVVGQSNGRTEMVIKCDTAELCDLPLHYLAPGLRRVYELVRGTECEGGEA